MRPYLYHKNRKKSILVSLLLLVLLPLESVRALTPNDPNVDQWSYRDIGVFDAWEHTTGSHDVVVAVIDDGFDSFHPELEPNVWHNTKEIPDNGIDDDGNGYIDDVNGWNFIDNTNDPRPSVLHTSTTGTLPDEISHGTMVAGIIGAVGNNGRYGAGINWQVRLMNLKVLGNSGIDSSIVPIANAIRYAVDNGADVINISLIGPEDDGVRAAVHYAYQHDVAVIAAAGNDYFSLNDYPRDPICADLGADEQWVLGVSAIDESHHLANFSNTGNCVDITAPGVHVSTTLRYAPAYGLNAQYGGPFSGTSFAAPFVSGAAALLKSIHPEWGAKEMYTTLLSTVHRTQPKDEYGYAQAFGRGLLQIDKAVALALSTASTGRSVDRIVAYTNRSTRRIGFNVQTTTGQTLTPVVVPSGLTNVEGIASYKDAQGMTYVVLQSITQKKKIVRQVTVFNGDWERLTSWNIPWSGPSSLTLVATEKQLPQVVVAPATASRVVFQAYTLQGKTVETYIAPEQHQGVVLGTLQLSNAREILAVYREHGETVLHDFDGTFALKSAVVLQDATTVGSVSAGDLDGNGSREYVIGSARGHVPRLTYYTADGGVLRTFAAYTDTYQGGLGVIVGDYDHDGRDDVLVSADNSQPAKLGAMPVRVWTGRSQILAEWWPFGTTYTGGVGLLAQFK